MGATTESSWSGGSRAAWLSAGADCCCGGFAQAALPEASAAIQKTAVHSRMMVLNLFLIDRYKFMVVGPFLPCAVRSQPRRSPLQDDPGEICGIDGMCRTD